MSIWKKSVSLAALNDFSHNTLIANVGIKFTDFDEQSLRATMPVDSRTQQPLGLLHGGASVVLAETLGSMAANLCVDESKYCVGLEINANHMRSVSGGEVLGIATPLHIGNTTQVWQIHIHDQKGRLLCSSRHTVAVLEHKGI